MAFGLSRNDGSINATTGVWSIPSIPAGHSATTALDAFRLLRSSSETRPVRFSARLISSAPPEPTGHEANNTTEAWYVADGANVRFIRADAGVTVQVRALSDN